MQFQFSFKAIAANFGRKLLLNLSCLTVLALLFVTTASASTVFGKDFSSSHQTKQFSTAVEAANFSNFADQNLQSHYSAINEVVEAGIIDDENEDDGQEEVHSNLNQQASFAYAPFLGLSNLAAHTNALAGSTAVPYFILYKSWKCFPA